ncbi:MULTISPECIES: succinate dehydrogenase, cytochrome b556 subunit [unclassified Candidatus Tisiphia]|uniref:succinate dehydrogenase, cytochrome b556 subunit n=1 Tax=unclassified Candidatus Tisiphia TaxID=2996318 RepID=UPI00312CA04D
MTKTKPEIYNNRPTSPHLMIYKIQISSVLSIFHRMTGIGLFFGLSVLSWCFILLAFSKFNPEYLQFFTCRLFKIPPIFISFAWFYHLCNGVRHLIWDSGHCFSIRAINFTGWFVVIASIMMTLAFWLL